MHPAFVAFVTHLQRHGQIVATLAWIDQGQILQRSLSAL